MSSLLLLLFCVCEFLFRKNVSGLKAKQTRGLSLWPLTGFNMTFVRRVHTEWR